MLHCIMLYHIVAAAQDRAAAGLGARLRGGLEGLRDRGGRPPLWELSCNHNDNDDNDNNNDNNNDNSNACIT